ncbi:MAG: diacylglycerol kinase family protein [Ruminococcaceae bacterium]|jgi:diacylglycerol kinase|nr:diacylglycerol kinase family protein [Oscillospiraceae bacterium]
MKKRLRSFADSFRWAGQGILLCIRNERNFRIHLVIAFYVVVLAALLKLDGLHFAALSITIGNVLVTELLNTAIEAVVDLASPQKHPLAKTAKDVAAGAVLISAIVSVSVGIFLLWQPEKLLALAGGFLASPFLIILLAVSAALSLWFIFGLEK